MENDLRQALLLHFLVEDVAPIEVLEVDRLEVDEVELVLGPGNRRDGV